MSGDELKRRERGMEYKGLRPRHLGKAMRRLILGLGRSVAIPVLNDLINTGWRI